jgi:hypothetical protein
MQEIDSAVQGEQKKLKIRERRLLNKRSTFDELVMSKAREQVCKQNAHLREREARYKDRAARFVRMQERAKRGGR